MNDIIFASCKELVGFFDKNIRPTIGESVTLCPNAAIEVLEASQHIINAQSRKLTREEVCDLDQIYSCTSDRVIVLSITLIVYGILEAILGIGFAGNETHEEAIEFASILALRIDDQLLTPEFIEVFDSLASKELKHWMKSSVSILIDEKLMDDHCLFSEVRKVMGYWQP